jgi:hypothetical protein
MWCLQARCRPAPWFGSRADRSALILYLASEADRILTAGSREQASRGCAAAVATRSAGMVRLAVLTALAGDIDLAQD